jgi:hypothetical protein
MEGSVERIGRDAAIADAGSRVIGSEDRDIDTDPDLE